MFWMIGGFLVLIFVLTGLVIWATGSRARTSRVLTWFSR